MPAPLFEVELRPKMKPKDLPEWFRPCFEVIPGALPDVRFRSGQFFALRWRQPHPLDWPVAEEIPLEPGDFLVALDDGGVGFRKADQQTY